MEIVIPPILVVRSRVHPFQVSSVQGERRGDQSTTLATYDLKTVEPKKKLKFFVPAQVTGLPIMVICFQMKRPYRIQ